MTADPAIVYERLKRETAAMLNLDVDSSSLLENLQVDLVSLLRLQIDDLQGKVLNGEQVDLARLSAALTMLRQLLPEKALVSSPPAADTGPDHEAAFRQIEVQLDNLLEQRRRKEVETGRCERCGAPLADATNANPGGGDGVFPASPPHAVAGSGPPMLVSAAPPRVDVGLATVSLPVADGDAQAGAGSRPPVPPAAPAPPPKRVESDVERMARVNAQPVPSHYLKQPDGEWRRHLDADGNIVAPYFRGGYG